MKISELLTLAVIDQLGRAWEACGFGRKPVESGFIIDRNGDPGPLLVGGLNDDTFTFQPGPEVAAFLHTHPSSHDPRPSRADVEIADRYGIVMFVFSSRAFWVYFNREFYLIAKPQQHQ